MLGKLIKYDLKSGRMYAGICIGIYVIITIITKAVFVSTSFLESGLENSVGWMRGLSIVSVVILYFLSLAAMAILPFIIIIRRFYQNLLCEEGYLMHTLPVKASTHIIAKTLSGVIWNILFLAVIAVSILIVFNQRGIVELVNWIMSEFWKFLSEYQGPLAVVYILKTIVGFFSGIMLFYAALCLGHITSKHRMAAAIGIYLGYSAVVAFIQMVIATFVQNMFTNDALYLLVNNIGGLVWNVVVLIGGFFICRYVLVRKLNLD